MSRTIRSKGHYLFEIEQLNNPFRYIRWSWYRKSGCTKAQLDKYIARQIERNIEVNKEIEQLKKECHRDGSHVTCRWKRYIEKNPRMHHKMAISESLKLDSDYIYDEKAERKARRGMAEKWD